MKNSKGIKENLIMNIIDKLSKQMKLPYWWVEAIAIEYTECREYGVGDEGIWEFNFEKIKEKDLEDALKNHKIVISSCTIFHNIRDEVLKTRMMEGLVSGLVVPLTTDISSCIVDGLASDFYIPFYFNPIELVDPKQHLNEYFLVYENNELWQWKFADIVAVEDRNYHKHISNHVDLEEFDKKYDIYKELYVEKNQNKLSSVLLENKIAEYFKWIDSIRRPLLSELYDLHKHKKNSPDYKSKATKGRPPQMSRFESYKIDLNGNGSNHYLFKMDSAPIFYQSCCQHEKKSREIISSIRSAKELPPRLDSIYQEKALAIITGIMCIEAFINSIGYEMLPEIWDRQEKLTLTDKIKVLLSLKGAENSDFNTSIEPFSTFINCITSRNWLVHSKPKYEPAKNYKQKIMTPTEYYLRDELIFNLPKRLKELIEHLCMNLNKNNPAWLYEASLWSFD